jgi:NADPH-dependent ferric siderophore reductase
MVSVGKVGDSTVRRRYTIRAFDSTARRVTLDVLLHGDGPGARWATSAGPGDHLEAIGPRGKVTLDGSARTHLFVGDEAFAPAAFVMTEARPPGTRSIILIEVDSKEDQLGLELPGPNDRLRWVHRSGPDGLESSGADGARLLSAMAEIEIDPSGAHAYVGGELRTVSALRQALLAMGFAADQLSTKPYWRAGSANANHGEPDRE